MTRDEITTYVLERFVVSSSRAGLVTQIENQAYRVYVRLVREFELLNDTADLVLTEDDPIVDLPNDFLKIRSLRVGGTVLGGPSTFETVNRAQAHRTATDSTGSGPRTYLFWSPDQLYLDPAPTEDDNDGATLFYVARPPAWTLGADTPSALPEEFHDLIAEEVIVRVGATQEEFAGHVPFASSVVAGLRAELDQELNARRGDGTARIQRRVYG